MPVAIVAADTIDGDTPTPEAWWGAIRIWSVADDGSRSRSEFVVFVCPDETPLPSGCVRLREEHRLDVRDGFHGFLQRAGVSLEDYAADPSRAFMLDMAAPTSMVEAYR